jgi:hypothetical protein
MIWFRGTFPRFRYDQLMNIGWKYMIPIGIGALVVYAIMGHDALERGTPRNTENESIHCRRWWSFRTAIIPQSLPKEVAKNTNPGFRCDNILTK